VASANTATMRPKALSLNKTTPSQIYPLHS
jgi:hypothetical protein